MGYLYFETFMNKNAMNIHVQVFLHMYVFISLGVNYWIIWVYMHSKSTKNWFFEKVNKINKSLATPNKEKKRKNPNQQNYTWKRRHFNGYHRNWSILRGTTIYQWTGQPRRKNIQLNKTESGRNRKSD